MFSELGYDAATFQAIAIRSDLTRPAINHYFESKLVLYREVIEQTNSMVVGAGFEKAKAQDTLLGRLSTFFSVVMQTDNKDRSVAAFLVTSVLESQRHPELAQESHNSLTSSREFVGWAIRDAINSGELTTDTDVELLVELLVAVMWGMGFYAGYVGSYEDLERIMEKFELLLANKLWTIAK